MAGMEELGKTLSCCDEVRVVGGVIREVVWEMGGREWNGARGSSRDESRGSDEVVRDGRGTSLQGKHSLIIVSLLYYHVIKFACIFVCIPSSLTCITCL